MAAMTQHASVVSEMKKWHVQFYAFGNIVSGGPLIGEAVLEARVACDALIGARKQIDDLRAKYIAMGGGEDDIKYDLGKARSVHVREWYGP